MTGTPATQMFNPGICIYKDTSNELYTTTFTITNNVTVQKVNLIGWAAYSGSNFIRATRGIILKAKPQDPSVIDPSLIDSEGYVTILDKLVYLPEDIDVPEGEARYVDCGDQVNFSVDHAWDVNEPLKIKSHEFRVQYRCDDSWYFSPRIDELDGMGGPTCGDQQHPWPAQDFNRDSYVNFKDFAVFAAGWLVCTSPEAPCNYTGN